MKTYQVTKHSDQKISSFFFQVRIEFLLVTEREFSIFKVENSVVFSRCGQKADFFIFPYSKRKEMEDTTCRKSNAISFYKRAKKRDGSQKFNVFVKNSLLSRDFVKRDGS